MVGASDAANQDGVDAVPAAVGRWESRVVLLR